MSIRDFGKDAGLKGIDAQARKARLEAFIGQNIEEVEEAMPAQSFSGDALKIKRGYVGVLVSTIRLMANGFIGIMQGPNARGPVPQPV